MNYKNARIQRIYSKHLQCSADTNKLSDSKFHSEEKGKPKNREEWTSVHGRRRSNAWRTRKKKIEENDSKEMRVS